MSRRRAWLQHRTRSQSFLWQMTIAVLVAGFAVAAALQSISPAPRLAELLAEPLESHGTSPDDGPGVDDPLRARPVQRDFAADVAAWLADPSTDFADVLDAMPTLKERSAAQEPPFDLARAIGESVGDESHRTIALALLRSIGAEAPDEPLAALADADEPQRWANYALGVWREASGQIASAAASFEREGRSPDAGRARERAIELYMRSDWFDEIDRLRADPLYAHVLTANVNYQLAELRDDYLGMLRWLWPMQFELMPWGAIALGALTGVFWLAFLLHVGEVFSWREARLWLCIAALAIGAASTVPTLLLLHLQETKLGVTDAGLGDLRDGLLYCLGIGLREELCKLIGVALLLPVLVRRRNAMEMLVVSACVGLGFAMEENMGYFSGSLGADSPGRFLTANFFHIAATALAGFALCQMILKPRDRAADFAVIFLGVVVLHALYDALIMVAPLAEFAYFSGAVFILLAYQFFHELHRYRRYTARPVSLTAVFLGGFALTLAATYNYLAWHLGLGLAADLLVPSALGVAIVIVLFLREINEPLSA